jgi:hypothetical protein
MDPITTSRLLSSHGTLFRPRRHPAPPATTQPPCIVGVNVPLPARSPPHARPYSTPPPTNRSPKPPSIVQPTRVSHGVLDDPHLTPPSPLFLPDSSPSPFFGASSSSSEPVFDDLDVGFLEDEDASSPTNLFYERWAPTIFSIYLFYIYIYYIFSGLF